MFFSLLQTLVCVLLVNSGLYALHLTASNTPGANGLNSNNGPPHISSQLTKSPPNNFQISSNRLNEELADLAQLERERLMVMGLVKQTAEESGYHGRPIITGRIKMHPAEDLDSEYSAWLNQQARNVMFGNVVKQPLNNEEDYDTGGAAAGRAFKTPNKYDYGHPAQMSEREFESPHNLDLDDFMELEPVQDEEDIFPDMDGYAYIEELIDEENNGRLQNHPQQQHQHQQQMLQFPGSRQQQTARTQQSVRVLPRSHSYQSHDSSMDLNQKVIQDFLEKEQQMQMQQYQQQQQQQRQQQQQANEFNAKYRNNIRMQQKWLRKRNQMQQQLPRNIFGQKNAKQQLVRPQHHPSSNKLATANSEATATSRVNSNKQTETAQQFQTQEQQQQHQKPKEQQVQQQQQQPLNDEAEKPQVSSSFSSSGTKSEKSSKTPEQKPELLQHPNHKRSGLTPASLASAAGVSSPHSLASQLMLRTARGQRQYDVPQIECPTAMDGMERFACPTPDVQGRYRCIDDHVLCDGFIDCPEGEDEDRRSCMFYKTTKAHLDVLADALLRWARGR